jgi:hypothetical protein
MGATNAWRDYVAAHVRVGAGTLYSNANSHLGVGDSVTAFANTQTDLQAGANKLRKAMEATYPTIAANVLTFRSLFATADANFAWQEWGVFNASSAGTMMCRKVESLGTKTSAQSWQLTATITITVP